MNWNDFYKSVKEGQFQNVYLFAGPEEWNKREALAALRKAILPVGLEELNESVLEGCSAQAIIDSAETLPVMCDYRLVVVRDWAPLCSGKAKAEDADVPRMLAWLQNMPESSIVVFYMTEVVDGRKKLASALMKREGYVEFAQLSGAILLKWCNQQLKPLKKKLHPDAMEELTLMAGQDLNRLSGELKKLAAYTGDAPEIQAADVRAIVAPSPEYSVFMILDHLLDGQLVEATQVADSVLQSNPRATPLINMIAKQLRIDAQMKYAMETGGNLAEVQKWLEVSPYRAKHIVRRIRSIPAKALLDRYQACVDTNYAITSGRVRERAAWNALMMKIVMPKDATKLQ